MTPTRFARDNSPPEADLSSALADGHSALPAGIPASAAVLAVGVLTVAIAAWFITPDRQTQILWLSLAIVGVVLSLVAWYQWLT